MKLTEEQKREQNRLRVAQWRVDNPEKYRASEEKQLARKKHMRRMYRELELANK